MRTVGCLTPLSGMSQEELKKLFGLTNGPESAQEIDPMNLPEETLEEFSYDGLEFEEAASKLWYHLTIMHYHAGSYNRHSQWFPLACEMLEKDIRLAGSFCLTKTVLEKQGYEFPCLEKMNIPRLYGLISYYFRKCSKAFEDLYHTAGVVSLDMHKWELRWLALGERLKATAEKCRNILEGKISVDSLLKRIEMYHPAPKERQHKIDITGEDCLMQSALPMIGCYARQIIRERNMEARKAYFERQWERTKKVFEEMETEEERENAAKRLADAIKAKESSASGQPQDEAETMAIPEMRRLLIEKAKQRGESAEIIRIIGEPPERLRERWQRYREEEARKNRAGPDADAKNKNRQKKKKRK